MGACFSATSQSFAANGPVRSLHVMDRTRFGWFFFVLLKFYFSFFYSAVIRKLFYWFTVFFFVFYSFASQSFTSNGHVRSLHVMDWTRFGWLANGPLEIKSGLTWNWMTIQDGYTLPTEQQHYYDQHTKPIDHHAAAVLGVTVTL